MHIKNTSFGAKCEKEVPELGETKRYMVQELGLLLYFQNVQCFISKFYIFTQLHSLQ